MIKLRDRNVSVGAQCYWRTARFRAIYRVYILQSSGTIDIPIEVLATVRGPDPTSSGWRRRTIRPGSRLVVSPDALQQELLLEEGQ